ncbi:GAF and ANTAR domain-containing protein [Nocardioides marinquilinus]|uniref:GAF and ANTAR domain-containing protein n=1 Tax=Nocardioides marinquilinus TaxID=1210400 RepID=A0ABP9PCR9_9ACTN
MTDTRPLDERMAEAARELHDQADVQLTYDSAVQLAVANVTGADAAGLTIASRGRKAETLAVTAGWVTTADRLQYTLDEGPCVDATWEHHLVHSPELTTDARWPTWGPRVFAETGARSVLSLQLFTHRDSLGAINLYSRTADAFDARDRTDGLTVAAHIAIAVAAAQSIAQLETAVASRTVIGNAVGMLMERFAFSEQRAFAALSRIASERGRKVRDVAQEVVSDHRARQETGSAPPGPTPPGDG